LYYFLQRGVIPKKKLKKPAAAKPPPAKPPPKPSPPRRLTARQAAKIEREKKREEELAAAKAEAIDEEEEEEDGIEGMDTDMEQAQAATQDTAVAPVEVEKDFGEAFAFDVGGGHVAEANLSGDAPGAAVTRQGNDKDKQETGGGDASNVSEAENGNKRSRGDAFTSAGGGGGDAGGDDDDDDDERKDKRPRQEDAGPIDSTAGGL